MREPRKEFFDFCCKICKREMPPSGFKKYRRPGRSKEFYRPYCKRCDSHLTISSRNKVDPAEARRQAAAHEWVSTEACDGIHHPPNVCRLCGTKTKRLIKCRCVECRRTMQRRMREGSKMPLEERKAYHEKALEDCRHQRWYVPDRLIGETAIGRICRTCNRDLPIEEYSLRTDRHKSGVPRRTDYRRECKQCSVHFGRCRWRNIPRARGRELAAAHEWLERVK